MILTVLIPTYNRAELVRSLVAALLKQATALSGDFEIVISDNGSNDQTAEMAKELCALHPLVRYHRHEKHFPTGEQNLLSAIPFCRGDFIWSLSDDDMPTDRAVSRVVEYIKADDFDFLLSNLSMVDVDGKVLRERVVSSLWELNATSYSDMVKCCGVVTLAACFSAAVFRKSIAEGDDWRQFVNISPIYSHVFFFLSAFGKSTCKFVSDPIVTYRNEGTPIAAWTLVGGERPQQFYYPWTIGLAKLVAYSIKMGFITQDFFLETVELGALEPFVLHLSVLRTFCDQIDRWLNMKRPGDAVTVKEFDEFAQAFNGAPQHIIQWLSEMRAIVGLLEEIHLWEGAGSSRYTSEKSDIDLHRVLSTLPAYLREQFLVEWSIALRAKIRKMRDRILVAIPGEFSRTTNLSSLNASSEKAHNALRPFIERVAKKVMLPRNEGIYGFDELYYVQANPKVAFSKIKPVVHFMQIGWKEGRDPSSWFSVNGYLNSNPDVKKAGINPFVHFLQHGISEGRTGWKKANNS